MDLAVMAGGWPVQRSASTNPRPRAGWWWYQLQHPAFSEEIPDRGAISLPRQRSVAKCGTARTSVLRKRHNGVGYRSHGSPCDEQRGCLQRAIEMGRTDKWQSNPQGLGPDIARWLPFARDQDVSRATVPQCAAGVHFRPVPKTLPPLEGGFPATRACHRQVLPDG
jgi:hypothetical protein